MQQFNRSLRRYSVKECSKTVTAHGIFDIIKVCIMQYVSICYRCAYFIVIPFTYIMQRKFLPAKTERDIFEILKLNYLEPWERNC